MFEITVRRQFKATHALRNLNGAMEPAHAHDWACEVTLEAETLDQSGCVADFKGVDAAVEDALSQISNRALHQIPEFDDTSPSAENLSLFLYKKISGLLNNKGRHVSRVVVWEDKDHSAAYFEQCA